MIIYDLNDQKSNMLQIKILTLKNGKKNDTKLYIFSGKAKEMSFDSLTNSSMLKSDWISQSSATQVLRSLV